MDPRLTPANEIVACSTLKGKIKHSNFVEGENYQINVPSVDLLGTPAGKRNRQLIYGSKVKYFDEAGGWHLSKMFTTIMLDTSLKIQLFQKQQRPI
jgi:hypothetical protein